MAGGAGQTRLACAFQFDIVLLGNFQDVSARHGGNLPPGAVSQSKSESDGLRTHQFDQLLRDHH